MRFAQDEDVINVSPIDTGVCRPVIHKGSDSEYRCNHRNHPGRSVPFVYPPLIRPIVQGVLTFLGCDWSSTGYHFWALSAGTTLWLFPNCFVWPSDMMAFGEGCMVVGWLLEIWVRTLLLSGVGSSAGIR